MKFREESTIFGIGPKLYFLTFVYWQLASIISAKFEFVFTISILSTKTASFISNILLIIGIPCLIMSILTLIIEFPKGKLMIKGVYSIVRNPIYSAWICLVMPGLAIETRSWLMLTVPFFMYRLFRVFIKKEERFLEEKFGQEYLDYKAKVGLIFPKFSLTQ